MSAVRLHFLGCGDAFGSGGRLQACLYLEGGGEPMLIDCGATALTALKRERIDPASIGSVALSHLHGDHFAGLPWLILDGQFAGRTRSLLIGGPRGTEQRLEQLFEALYPGAIAQQREFDVQATELAAEAPSTLGPAIVTPFEVAHSSGSPSFGLRLEYGGKVIGYTGDSEWTEALLEVARAADVFVCECNYFDKRVPGHLDFSTLAAHRERLECERLVLTHMSEEMLARAPELGVETAHDGMVIEV